MSSAHAAHLARQALAVFKRADSEGRELTWDEEWRVKHLLDAVDDLRGRELRSKLDGPMTAQYTDPRYDRPLYASPGDLFVESAGFKRIAHPEARGQRWSTGPVEVGLAGKGTLLEADDPGGAGLASIPQLVPGIVDTLFEPLTIEQLLLGGQASGPTVRYIAETTATNAAAGVAEGGLKPESTLAFDTTDEPVKKVATAITTSDEVLEDVDAIRSFINRRLGNFVNIEVERQLLRGTASGNEVQGLLVGRSVPVYAGGTADSKAQQLFNAMNGARGSAFIEPEWRVLHPLDYEEIRLSTDTTGQYFGGGPFLGAYGGPGPLAASGQVTGGVDRLWGKAVHVTAAIGGAGTALIGSRAGAQVWNRGGLSVEASNAAGDNFVYDRVTFRAERRLALSVFRPQAFTEVRLA